MNSENEEKNQMESFPKVVIRKKAFHKIFLHSIKYASETVVGVLVGVKLQGALEIVDALPLCHRYPLAPMLEMGFIQCEAFCDAPQMLVGCYVADGGDKNATLKLAERLARKIKENESFSLVAMIENASFKNISNESMKFLQYDKKLKPLSGNNGLELLEDKSSGISTLKKFIEEQRYLRLFDFEEHLEDAKRDWLNSELV